MAKFKKPSTSSGPAIVPESVMRKVSPDVGARLRETDHNASASPEVVIISRGMGDSVFAELAQWAERQEGVRARKAEFYADVVQKFSRIGKSIRPRHIVLAPIFNKADLMELDRFLSWRRAEQLEMELPVLVLTRFQTPQLWSYLRERGCVTYLPGFTNIKELKQSLLKNYRLLEIAASRKIPEYLAVLFIAGAKLPQFKILWQHALDVAQDWWVVPTERFIYEMRSLWMVSLLGPSPRGGSWESGGQNQLWKWVPAGRSSKGAHRHTSNWASQDGLWHFHGKKPRYFAGRWFFIGKSPDLYFVKSGQEKFHKFQVVDTHEIMVRPNSSNTLYRLSDRVLAGKDEEETIDFKTGFILSDPEKKRNGRRKPAKEKATIDGDATEIEELQKSKSYFSTLNDPEKLIALLRELCTQKTPVQVWVRGRRAKGAGFFRLIDEEKLRVALDFNDNGESAQFNSVLSESSDQKILGYFKSSLGLIFFIVNQYEILPMSQKFVLELKHVLFQVQRRKAARLAVPADFPLSVQVGEHIVKVADVSISGFGVYVESSRPPFKNGDTVPIVAVWQGSVLNFSAEVRWQKPTPRSARAYGSFHVGLFVRTTTLEEVTQLGLMLFELQTYDSV